MRDEEKRKKDLDKLLTKSKSQKKLFIYKNENQEAQQAEIYRETPLSTPKRKGYESPISMKESVISNNPSLRSPRPERQYYKAHKNASFRNHQREKFENSKEYDEIWVNKLGEILK